MSMSVQGKTAIVTGAARGIGLAIAQHLVERGANVMFADSDEEALESQVSDYDTETGPVRQFVGHMTEKLAMANLLSATLDAFERIDILVNAHRFVKSSDPLDTDPGVIEEMLRQNMIAGLRLSQMVAKRMIKQAEDQRDLAQAGAIVNISTLAACRPVPSMLGYSIACAAQEQSTRGLALALAPYRIRVNGVSFSSIMSHELKCALRDDMDLRAQIISGTPLGRIGGADEVAETVQYLVSEGARFVTGQIVTVDGGRSLADPVTAQVL
ncbi:MAG: oxidoreductase [Paracoccus sp.]|uniref:SDR family NAD(P)-dependent oxidoreductase n=1 Tax=Paracoccus sp. TaxID=267 RepID=UPI000C42324B|nr:SDR family oxidoreductase [Paracoccus sp. (in: a-proteobacteria)]MBA48456.1 oxidoreductase [Paracoccus sp. (in: a-proteobacteria)]